MAPHKTSYKPSVRDFLFSVRLLSLFFASIAFFQFIYQQAGEAHGTYFYLLYAPLAVCGVCIAVFLCISNVYRAAGRYARQLKVLECVLMSAIFLCAIAVTGLYQSQYKILFLFLIISYTFEYGMRAGLYLAVFASLSIVGIDLVWAPVKGGVNLYFQNDLLLCGAFIVTAWALGFYAQMRQEHIASLERQINTDGLTGLLNHRNFYDVVQLCYDTAQKEGTPLSLIFADIDYFTTYNDCHGHQQGDLALKETADLLASTAGQKGQLFRYSGAKFACILPGMDQQQATVLARQMRDAIDQHPFYGQELLPAGSLTISCGVCGLSSRHLSCNQFVQECDDALYRAKFFRKNRVEVYVSLLDQFRAAGDTDDFENSLSSIRALISVVNSRDLYTFGHTERVVYYASLMAKRLHLSRADSRALLYGAYVHDVGKINVAKEILLKPIALTDEEWAEMKKHPSDGAYIIRNLPSLSFVADLVEHHHERYDGSGYPHGLKGEEISYLARILTLVDSFDAIISKRPYKKARTIDEAIAELLRCRGTQFDPTLTDILVEELRSFHSAPYGA